MRVGGDQHPLKAELRSSIAGMTDPEEIVEAVMRLLHDQRMVMVRAEGELALLTPAARLAVDLALHPGTSLRQSAQRLGTTYSNVNRQMTHLSKAGLVERTFVDRSYVYSLKRTELLHHSDIGALLEALLASR